MLRRAFFRLICVVPTAAAATVAVLESGCEPAPVPAPAAPAIPIQPKSIHHGKPPLPPIAYDPAIYSLIEHAMMMLQIVAPGEIVSAEDYRLGYEVLDRLLDRWNRGTVYRSGIGGVHPLLLAQELRPYYFGLPSGSLSQRTSA